MSPRLDLTGQKFGRLTAKKLAHIADHNQAYWLCRCDCGNTNTVSLGNLRSGKVKSCGCLRLEWSRKERSAEHVAHQQAARRAYLESGQFRERMLVVNKARWKRWWKKLSAQYGVTVPMLKKLRRRFNEQRQNAKGRGISFKLTFDQWLSIWQSSGHLKQRGNKQNTQYCMGRIGDKGPYAVGNVKIMLGSENRHESWGVP